MGQALGCVQVDQSTVAIKEHFGRFAEVLEPGCHCLPWCLGYQVAGELSLRVQQLDVRCETKTKAREFLNSAKNFHTTVIWYAFCQIKHNQH